MQINLPEETVERCRSFMNKKETWACFVERILDVYEESKAKMNDGR
jgi:hypothetical protein